MAKKILTIKVKDQSTVFCNQGWICLSGNMMFKKDLILMGLVKFDNELYNHRVIKGEDFGYSNFGNDIVTLPKLAQLVPSDVDNLNKLHKLEVGCRIGRIYYEGYYYQFTKEDKNKTEVVFYNENYLEIMEKAEFTCVHGGRLASGVFKNKHNEIVGIVMPCRLGEKLQGILNSY